MTSPDRVIEFERIGNLRIIKIDNVFKTQRLSQVGPQHTGAVRYEWVTLYEGNTFLGAEQVFLREKSFSAPKSVSVYSLLSTLWRKVKAQELLATEAQETANS